MYPAFLDDPYIIYAILLLCTFSMNLLYTNIGQYINQLVVLRKIFRYLLPLLAPKLFATLPSQHGTEIAFNNILFTKDLWLIWGGTVKKDVP